MKTSKSDHKKVESFNPDSAFIKMFDLLTQIQGLTATNIKNADYQKQELNKEIYMLSKSTKEFYKGKSNKTRKKEKDSK